MGLMNGFVATMVRRYLGSRRGFTRVVTAFSVLGIMLGVAALLIVLAVMSGFRAELMSRILGVSGHATLEIAGLELPAARALAVELEKIEGVVSAVPYVSGQVMVSAGGRATGAYVRGVEGNFVADVQAHTGLKMEILGEDLGAPQQVLLGQGLAANLGVLPGGGVTMLSPEGARTVAGFIPRTAQVGVAGIFGVGMVQFDNGLIVGRLEDIQMFLRRGERVDAVEIRVKNPQKMNDVNETIVTVASEFAEHKSDVILTTWQATNGEFFRALQVERITMFIILSLIVLVAAFNIITGQMMLVNDKLQDIAILRTMGATRRQIRRIFLFNGLMLGGMGTLGGIVLGLLVIFNMTEVVRGIRVMTGVDLFPRDVYFLSDLPSKVSMLDMGLVVAMAMVLTVLASLYPAWRASQFEPVELLKRG